MTTPLQTQIGEQTAFSIVDQVSGCKVDELWLIQTDSVLGPKPHRLGGPARIVRDPLTETVTYEAWMVDGMIHRDDGPALTLRDSRSGVPIAEKWFDRDKLSRAGEPAFVMRDALTGVALYEAWHQAGRLHRDGAPARIWRDAAGAILRQEWWTAKDGRQSVTEAGTVPQDMLCPEAPPHIRAAFLKLIG